MKIKYVYLLLCIFGFILPYSQIIPLMFEQSLSLNLLFEQLFANRVSTLFALDLFVTATVFVVFTIREGMKLKIKHLWLPFAATFLVGASLGFPLFLYLREINLEKSKK
jgi:hypothetical protein